MSRSCRWSWIFSCIFDYILKFWHTFLDLFILIWILENLYNKLAVLYIGGLHNSMYLLILHFFTSQLVIRQQLDKTNYCVKSVRIRSYSGPHFPAFGLNTERYFVSLRIQSECGKIRTRITLNADTFRAMNTSKR